MMQQVSIWRLLAAEDQACSGCIFPLKHVFQASDAHTAAVQSNARPDNLLSKQIREYQAVKALTGAGVSAVRPAAG